ncbi:hypothetical protein [Pseudorhodoferax sp.]|uniref:hypothetical protein n=1 Tax=Pseudorhodoferax sp. TaxID=1993553 RepID=UPI002DD68A43|nr:hypothetical protein [Pseudorhodoferax sp.]
MASGEILTGNPESSLGKAKRLLEVLSIVLGAIWVFALYFDFRRDQEKLKTEQIRLSNEAQLLSNNQIKEMAHVEQRAKEIALDQQRLSLKQAELLAANERDRARVSLEQQRLSLQTSRLTAEADVEKARLAARIAELDSKLKSSQVAFATQGRISTEVTLQVFCPKHNGPYEAHFEYAVTNSSTTDVELTWTMVHMYLGTVKPVPGKKFATVNNPPVGIFNVKPEGDIEWEELNRTGSILEGRDRLRLALLEAGWMLRRGQGATNILRPGDRGLEREVHLIYGTPDQHIGFSLAFGLDSAIGGDGTYRRSRSQQLANCAKGS